MSLLFTVEHTGGGSRCADCHGEQDRDGVNLKVEGMYSGVSRYRFCRRCAARLTDSFVLALYRGEGLTALKAAKLG